jgi:hypothetical protein
MHLRPTAHIDKFSIEKEDGTQIATIHFYADAGPDEREWVRERIDDLPTVQMGRLRAMLRPLVLEMHRQSIALATVTLELSEENAG